MYTIKDSKKQVQDYIFPKVTSNSCGDSIVLTMVEIYGAMLSVNDFSHNGIPAAIIILYNSNADMTKHYNMVHRYLCSIISDDSNVTDITKVTMGSLPNTTAFRDLIL